MINCFEKDVKTLRVPSCVCVVSSELSQFILICLATKKVKKSYCETEVLHSVSVQHFSVCTLVSTFFSFYLICPTTKQPTNPAVKWKCWLDSEQLCCFFPSVSMKPIPGTHTHGSIGNFCVFMHVYQYCFWRNCLNEAQAPLKYKLLQLTPTARVLLHTRFST